MAVKFSLSIKLVKIKDYQDIIEHILKLRLPSNIKNYFSIRDIDKILSFMMTDKKNFSKKINLILLKRIGLTIINNEYTHLQIKKFLKKELVN